MQFIAFPKIDVKAEGMELIRIPKMVRVRQLFDTGRIVDLKAHIEGQMHRNLGSHGRFRGKRICVTMGSRGIPGLDVMGRAIIDTLKGWGARPFIVPAMGSHGGGTAEGQREVLAAYHITEESMGVPILSSMEAVQVGGMADGTPVYCDRHAYESDGIVILNKVKPHTDFLGRYGSGMAKMIAIGIAKHMGASMFHLKGFATFAERIPQACEVFLRNAPVAFGVGVVQNAYDEISDIEVMEKDLIMQKDAELLEIAKAKMAKFKFPHIDVLIVDEIGKNVSGNGHDPYITARSNSPGFEDMMSIQKLFIRGLNEETRHNGCGIAMADITTRRCLNGIDFQSTWVNVVTSTRLNGGRIPMYAENDRDALMLAIRTCVGPAFDIDRVKVVRIRDTLHMSEIEVSESYLGEIADHPEIEILGEPYDMEFDGEGFMR